MSLVTAYVQSREGNWYANPVVEEDGWFICWDDDEPIELVISKASGLMAQTILNRLKKQGWTLDVLYKSDCCGERIFGKSFKPAHSYFLRHRNGAPSDKMLARFSSSLGKRMPQAQGVFYFQL